MGGKALGMVHIVVGKLGAGKGLVVMRRILEEIVNGTRDIVTNVPIRLGPWVNGQKQAQMGLSAYLEREYGEAFDVASRLKVIDNADDCQFMFLWRRDSETNEWFKLPLEEKEGVPARFSIEPIKARHCNPCLVVSDEAWEYFPAKGSGWQTVPPVVPFYGRQQRKLRDEWYVVSQHHGDFHNVFERITQDYTVCRNHGMERLGIFRQPKVFHTVTYLRQPKLGARAFHEAVFRLDVAGLAQCYDTSAGVGMSGGLTADHGQKQKGLHIAWLVLGIVVVVVGLFLVPSVLGKGASAWIGHAANPRGQKPEAWSHVTDSPAPAAVTSAGTSTARQPGQVASSVVSTPQPTNSPVCITGTIQIGNRYRVCLSDGRIVDPGSGLELLTRSGAVVDGQWIRWGHPVNGSVASHATAFLPR